MLDKLKASGTIPIARTGDAFALSHTYWVTLISVGRKAWLDMSGGKLFADDKTKFTALCTGKWKMDTPWNRKTAEVTKRLFQYWPTGSTSLKAGRYRAALPDAEGRPLARDARQPGADDPPARR